MRSSVYRYVILLAILFAGLWFDLYTKEWARNSLQHGPNREVLGGFVELGYTENRGMVFGLLNKEEFAPFHPVLKHLTLIGTFFIFVFIIVNRKRPTRFLLPFSLVLAGALGNALDKLRFGFVIDFIHLQIKGVIDWPFFFNIADALLCVGIAWLIIHGSTDRDEVHRNGRAV